MTPGGPFRVRFTPTGRNQMRSLLVRAAAAGLWDRVAGALRQIENELSTRPREWGDPVSNYPAAALTTYRRLHDDLAVSYAVHDTEPVLWITRAVAVLDHPLREE